jgi:2-iminobutanoate/2-iminopropanoate deaminase
LKKRGDLVEQQAIKSQQAPEPIGPYSQAIRLGEFVFVSGQTGMDPGTGKLIDEDVETQTVQALKNLDAVLRAAGSSLKQVVKTTVFLIDLSEFKAMNAIYAQHFVEMPPARSTVQVGGLPGGARVEIEAVAFIP